MRQTHKNLIIDMDGTICTEEKTFNKYLATPQINAINSVNDLYDQNYHITIYTARGWAEYRMTEHWLKSHNIKYDLLICGKPIYDYWIDDKALRYDTWENIMKDLNK